jgi:alginate O-acetyltransferase complex protein AlgI
MVFSSIIFIFYFLPAFLLAYYLSGWRTAVLLAGSALFYAWGEGAFLALLVGLIAANYAGVRVMDRSSGGARQALLTAIIVTDLAVLGWFKYAGFVGRSLNEILPNDPFPEASHHLLLGISFFTFQLVSYAIDIYRRVLPAERSLVRFATYVLMFPHLIAGPIVRYAHIADELHSDRRRSGRVGLGVQYFIVGLCQKVLVANAVAPLADFAFGLPASSLDATTAWLGAVAYTLQIYFDFCGYSNMAIGLAFMLGFTFPRNFDYPYAAASITDFWRRWHISLSSWFRDYVYIPLGGNRGGKLATLRNLLIVFLLTGLWHGAAWTFVVWGLFHGAFLILERVGFGRLLARAPSLLRHAYVLLVVIAGWVIFRAETMAQASDYLSAMANFRSFQAPRLELAQLINTEVLATLAVGAVLSFPVVPALLQRLKAARSDAPSPDLPARLDTRSTHAVPTPLLLAGLALSVAVLAGTTLNPFLYFRF